jgi:DUF1365 family protein
MNPVTFYYCFDRDNTQVETIVAEITNTPWKERHAYVLSTRNCVNSSIDPDRENSVIPAKAGIHPIELDPRLRLPWTAEVLETQERFPVRGNDDQGTSRKVGEHLRFLFKKEFHVSPFMPMRIDYDWRFSIPGERLTVHMQNKQGDAKLFDATLDVHRREITGSSLAHTLVSFPLMTTKVIVGIYWQALRLCLKRIPFHSHPSPPGMTSSDNEHDSRPSSIS